MNIYISGPISNMPDGNIAAFTQAEIALQAKYPEAKIFNPHRNGVPKDAPWSDHMRADIKMLMDRDCVCALDGWRESKGASLEVTLAAALGMTIFTLKEWLS